MILEVHIANIKQEIAEMMMHGHQVNFGIEVAMSAIDYECDKMAAINDRNEGRQNE